MRNTKNLWKQPPILFFCDWFSHSSITCLTRFWEKFKALNIIFISTPSTCRFMMACLSFFWASSLSNLSFFPAFSLISNVQKINWTFMQRDFIIHKAKKRKHSRTTLSFFNAVYCKILNRTGAPAKMFKLLFVRY